MRGRIGCSIILAVLSWAWQAAAHPMVENALEIVIDRQKITIEARVSMEEVLLVEVDPTAPRDYWPTLVETHGEYVPKHLRVSADGQAVAGKMIGSAAPQAPKGQTPAGSTMAIYRMEYALAGPPRMVRVVQDFLREYPNWGASFVVRIRQSTDESFQTALLTREKSIEFGCEWPAGATTRAVAAARTDVKFGPTLRAYTAHGIEHIIGPFGAEGWNWRKAGFDHLLFATALVLATRRLRDLVKVVTAFTLAHTLTLTLSVLNLVTLSERIVEPMIAASIVFVAFQNVFWPGQSAGRLRLVVAFAFGLFHGLGFAGALKEAMSDMPGIGLTAALVGFSVGVEMGHQMVVLPLFGALYAGRNWKATEPRARMSELVARYSSAVVGVLGAWYLIAALRQP